MCAVKNNEGNTEIIFEDHIKKYADAYALGKSEHNWVFERYSTKNPKIDKLLAGASKTIGAGKGKPDFIIQHRNNLDFIIVVECKANTLKHESSTQDQYADYAVDGALLYSSFLSKGYDVLSIAVSGESNANLKVSHFLQFKGESEAVPMFSDKLLELDDYLSGYICSPEKFRQDYNHLIDFSKLLNDKLHSWKIAEDERALLISCILIALENVGFVDTYASYSDSRQLTEYLITTVKNEFQNNGINGEKLNVLNSRFGFIATDATLSKKEGVLKEIIIDINDNIKDFIKNHKYFDVLGQLYIEFLRYANADKGLGIVLTPPHITEFMAELAEVNRESIVYDNCAGTGGFLVSAMNLMIKDAKGDNERIRNIKAQQLIGTEYQTKIFALACSNMFIHQDGKTNMFHGDCFDSKIIDDVKEKHPTVGLLNPPYQDDKKKDTDEYEFILNNLDCLEQGARCVAIVPIQKAISIKGKVLDYKTALLRNHTLEAVFSMPNELFFNSKVAVVSCIMVITAKRPHPEDKEVFFGYYKDDGFVKRKNKGRFDLYGKFEQHIKKEWITAYRNHKEIPGLAVNQIVGAADEWCAEAYLKTDYSKLTQADFQQTINDYLAYLIKRGDYETL